MENEFMLKEQIRALEEKLLNTDVRTSPDKLSRLLTDDFFEIGSSGRVWRKQDLMGEQGAGEVRMTLSEFDMYPISGEAVLATYRIMNEDTGIETLRSSIWKFRDERWQMFFHQGTPVKGLG